MNNRATDLAEFDEDMKLGEEILREAGLLDVEDLPAAEFIITDEREELATGRETLHEAENSAAERITATMEARSSGALVSDDDGDDLDR